MPNLKKFGNKKGQAGGLGIFLSIVTTLFVIGLVVMVFTLAGGNLSKTVEETGAANQTSQNGLLVDDAGVNLADCIAQRKGQITSITASNTTSGTEIPADNFTFSGCTLTALGTSLFNDTDWNLTYNFTHITNPDTLDVINGTKTSLASTIDWFDIFVVLAALVVLVLLVVIIIRAISGSGLLGDNSP